MVKRLKPIRDWFEASLFVDVNARLGVADRYCLEILRQKGLHRHCSRYKSSKSALSVGQRGIEEEEEEEEKNHSTGSPTIASLHCFLYRTMGVKLEHAVHVWMFLAQ